MAPMKRTRESASKKNDKLKRRKRAVDNTDTLYKCLGKLCGEECQQDLALVRGGEPPRRDSRSVPKRDRRDGRHDELRDAMTDLSDEEYEDEGPSQGSGVAKSGRVGKVTKPKKGSNNELPFKQGVQKAKRWLCAALDFGVQSEYLRLEDSKGKVLRVASELLQVGNEGGAGGNSNRMRVLQRVAGDEPLPPRSLQQRKRRRDEMMPEEQRDDDDMTERSKRRNRRNRSRSSKHGGKKRSVRSRSRGHSRSKRRHGKSRRTVRSRSENPEGEKGPQQVGGTEDAEQDDMDCKESGIADSEKRRDENNSSQHEDDKSSVKSLKSTQNSDSQNTVEEKKSTEDDGSNDEDEDDEDDGKKK